MTVKDRIFKFLEVKDISITKTESILGWSKGSLLKANSISSDRLGEFILHFPDADINWLLTGEGSMLKKESTPVPQVPARKRIPLYDDVSTIGGLNDNIANTSDTPSPSEWIDAGDWFPEATAAIRHYGDSMVEYPSGSILALKRVKDQRLILNGRNYVIETTEFRVTKQLQYDGGDYIMAYSSNRETYPDGRLIHAPIKIPTETVRHIDLVLGCVTKEYSNGAIAIKR